MCTPGLDAPSIAEAYAAVRSDRSDTNWLLLAHAGDELRLASQGSGGLDELRGQLRDDQVQYGYVRLEYANDRESRRVKFVLVVWIGERTRVMRKARVSIETADVARALPHHSLKVDAADRDKDILEEDLVKRLRAAGGADYDGGRG